MKKAGYAAKVRTIKPLFYKYVFEGPDLRLRQRRKAFDVVS
jgi:hypothetical protein